MIANMTNAESVLHGDTLPHFGPECSRSETASAQPVRILLVDDNKAFLESAREELSLQPGFEVVGCAHTGRDALAMTQELLPQVVFVDLFAVLLDLYVPGRNSMETVVRLKAMPNAPKVIILSHRDSDYRPLAIAAGADDFLVKPQFKLLARSTVRNLTRRN